MCTIDPSPSPSPSPSIPLPLPLTVASSTIFVDDYDTIASKGECSTAAGRMPFCKTSDVSLSYTECEAMCNAESSCAAFSLRSNNECLIHLPPGFTECPSGTYTNDGWKSYPGSSPATKGDGDGYWQCYNRKKGKIEPRVGCEPSKPGRI